MGNGDQMNKSVLIVLVPDPDEGYSGFVPFLPGVVSQGESIEETFTNTEEALRACVEEYVKNGMAVPFLPENSIDRWGGGGTIEESIRNAAFKRYVDIEIP